MVILVSSRNITLVVLFITSSECYQYSSILTNPDNFKCNLLGHSEAKNGAIFLLILITAPSVTSPPKCCSVLVFPHAPTSHGIKLKGNGFPSLVQGNKVDPC